MQDKIFKKYDIRGKVGTELIIDQADKLGKAIAFFFKDQMPKLKRVAIGWDGRTHSPEFKDLLIEGLRASGIDVLSIGLCPTPVLYFTTHMEPVDAGLIVTASHNGPEYNGIKIVLNKLTVWGDQVQKIKQHFKNGDVIDSVESGSLEHTEMIPRYIAWMRKEFTHLAGLPVAFTVDCGNGAAGAVMPQLVKAFDWPNVRLLYEEVDGAYPNHEADPTVVQNMQDLCDIMIADGNRFGIGFDGDADRMAAVTESGRLVLGDELLALFARDLLAKNPGATIVGDVKCSQGLVQVVEESGGTLHFSACGHSLVKQAMRTTNALLGGEYSCHFYFYDRFLGYDDGFYAMMRLVELVYQSKTTLNELLSFFPKFVSTPEFRLVYEDKDLQELVKCAGDSLRERFGGATTTIDGVRLKQGNAWGILRASNTQPMLSLRFEAPTQEELDNMKVIFERTLDQKLGSGWLTGA
ncbi:phosphomannomutase/phosphoglucomutase [bacterium]|jgi:phosphomannomutase / phosphoglucomutase|nr:phosphomannomutase/phosphoglucomutase [bacterium]MBT3903233.1 phosphomannomutase/phosphoglucomutase [bacterium]MBT4578182.1 phosphomannomutase/phosphoglucomutase [bacterium]MBT5345557.1 phosphomannomutase/phosphoglucomutase [bacterium]MBT6131084.1 phosphomannomutase/phosphoglucomutase [bacterium]